MPETVLDKVSVARFIKQVRDIDRIRIEISGGQNAMIAPYAYKRAPEKDKTVQWWLDARKIKDHLPRDATLKIWDRTDAPAGPTTSLKFVIRDE